MPDSELRIDCYTPLPDDTLLLGYWPADGPPTLIVHAANWAALDAAQRARAVAFLCAPDAPPTEPRDDTLRVWGVRVPAPSARLRALLRALPAAFWDRLLATSLLR